MKKYVKPDVYYENFELSRNIASCSLVGASSQEIKDGHMATYSDGNSCTLTYYDVILFNNSSCESAPEGTYGEDYCYQTGSLINHYFAS